jgi:hypothetical protein
MKPEVISSLNKISSSLYDNPPIEAAKPLLRGTVLNNAFLDDAEITNMNMVDGVLTMSINYKPKYPLTYIKLDVAI